MSALLTLSLCAGLVFYNTTVATSLETPITQSLHLSASDVPLFVSITALATAPVVLLAGAVSDRLGRKSALIGGLLVLAIGSLGVGIVSPVWAVLAFRAIQGLGAGFIVVVSLAMASVSLGEERRPLAIAIYSSVIMLGLLAGSVLGGVAAAGGGTSWRWAFLGLGIVAVAAIVPCRSLLDEATMGAPADRRNRRLDFLGALFSILALGGIVTGITEGDVWGWSSWKTLLAIIAGLAFGVLLFVYEARRRGGLFDPRVFRSRTFTLSSLHVIVELAWAIGASVYVGLIFEVDLKMSPVHAGLAYIPMTGVAALMMPIIGSFTRKVGVRRLLMCAGVCGTAGYAYALLTVDSGGLEYAKLLPALVLLGLGQACAAPSQATAMLEAVPVEHASEGSALNASALQIGAAIGPGVVASIFSARYPELVGQAMAAVHAPGGSMAQLPGLLGDAFASATRPAAIAMAALAACGFVIATGISSKKKGEMRTPED